MGKQAAFPSADALLLLSLVPCNRRPFLSPRSRSKPSINIFYAQDSVCFENNRALLITIFRCLKSLFSSGDGDGMIHRSYFKIRTTFIFLLKMDVGYPSDGI